MSFQLTIKSLTGEKFDLSVNGEMTVKDLKSTIHTEKGAGFAEEGMKLIHKGKLLGEDNQTLNDAGISSSSFVVCMVAKTAAAPAPAPAPAAPHQTEHTTPIVSSAPARLPVDAAPVQAPPVQQPVVPGPEVEAAIQNLIAFGYPDADVRAAMAAAFNNPDRAYEYLADGLPSTAGHSSARPTTLPAVRPVIPADKFAAIRALPYFQDMKQQCRENPGAIRTVLERVRNDNPDLIAVITNNLDEFTALMNEEESEPDTYLGGEEGGMDPTQVQAIITQLMALPAEQRRVALERYGLTEEQFQQILASATRPPPVSVELTETENQAVQSLMEIFQLPREIVIQAYIACDKNEEYTASYLSDHGADF